MFKSGNQLIIGILLGLVLALLIGKKFISKQPAPVPGTTQIQPDRRVEPSTVKQHPVQERTDASIPPKVYEVLNYIQLHHRAMDGYVGGRIFSNREQILAQTDNNGNPIQYQEWDVNPKIQGQNRGAERIITGSDGRSWYTRDHYQTFKEIK